MAGKSKLNENNQGRILNMATEYRDLIIELKRCR